MKKLYEAPEAEMICFAPMEAVASTFDEYYASFFGDPNALASSPFVDVDTSAEGSPFD